MSVDIINFQIKSKTLDELANLLKSKEFISLFSDQQLAFFTKTDKATNKPLFITFAAQSLNHIKMLLNEDVIIRHGHDFCFRLVQISDQNNMDIIELSSRKTVDFLQEILNSKVFKEILTPTDLFTIFSKPNKYNMTNFSLIMDKSFEHFKILLKSSIINKISESNTFNLLNLASDEAGKLNSFWSAILKGEDYWDLLLNSNLLNKLNSVEISTLLEEKYTEDNGDIPLGYVVKHFSYTELNKFLSSKAFKKMHSEGEYKQYITQNDNDRTVLEIAMNKNIETFKLLLECPRCFYVLTDEQKVNILTTSHTKTGLSIIYNTILANSDYESLILNSEVIIDMAQEEKIKLLNSVLYSNLNSIEDRNEYLAPDPEIVDNPERLDILKNSALFQSLDQDVQQKLLGQQSEPAEESE